MKDFSEFESKINIKFKNQDLLKEAFTHRSYLNENPSWPVGQNERLEFLGDAVLELAVTVFLLANCFEALIGAIYLDQGYDSASRFIHENILPKMDEILNKKLFRDSKSLFQERAQEITGITPSYEVVKEWGPDHDNHFVVGVYVGKELVAQGEGPSKQEAQQQAAMAGLKAKGWE